MIGISVIPEDFPILRDIIVDAFIDPLFLAINRMIIFLICKFIILIEFSVIYVDFSDGPQIKTSLVLYFFF